MNQPDQLFKLLGVNGRDGEGLSKFAKKSGVSVRKLRYYNDNNILPSGTDLKLLLEASGLAELELTLGMGRLDSSVIGSIQKRAKDIAKIIGSEEKIEQQNQRTCSVAFTTTQGKLYRGDCQEILKTMASESVDLVFADPPFNLKKLYPSNIDDNLKSERYIHWCQQWIQECIRVLKHGGSLFLWNLPRWNVALSSFLDGRLNFRHWISVDIKYSLPIHGRLYPSHYALLYYVKGDKPNVFHPDRLPMQVCPHCYGDLKDYGGYKDKMNPLGVNLSDIWTDIPPVRHAKYKRRNGANELSLKLVDRIVEMASNEGDLIFDPFGGSGTTYMVAELKSRRWLGCEIGP
ncbi:MAG: site-specific DNA-methyltransferase, partial [Acidobacteria bacterium]